MLAYRESSNCQGFLYIVEWSLHYNIYHLEAIVLVIWGNANKSEVNQTGHGAGFLSGHLFYSTEELFGKVSHRIKKIVSNHENQYDMILYYSNPSLYHVI